MSKDTQQRQQQQQQQEQDNGLLGIITEDPNNAALSSGVDGFADRMATTETPSRTGTKPPSTAGQTMGGRSLSTKSGGCGSDVTITRASPMHAIWAGLSGMRYVRRTGSPSFQRFLHRPNQVHLRSWLYHGAFDFFLIADNSTSRTPEV